MSREIFHVPVTDQSEGSVIVPFTNLEKEKLDFGLTEAERTQVGEHMAHSIFSNIDVQATKVYIDEFNETLEAADGTVKLRFEAQDVAGDVDLDNLSELENAA